jgi:hypothetical protein
MSESDGSDWRERQQLGELIKEVCFTTGVVNPRKYDKPIILAAKSLHPQFGRSHADLWFTAFRRSASEYVLQEDQDAVGENSRRHCGRPQAFSPFDQPASASPPRAQLSPLPYNPTHSQASRHQQVSTMMNIIASGAQPFYIPLFRFDSLTILALAQLKKRYTTNKERCTTTFTHSDTMKQPFEISLPHLISCWTDDKHNNRAHVLVAMPSGTRPADIISTQVAKGGSSLDIVWKWPDEMFDAHRLFSHSRFKGVIDSSHPKYIALQQAMHKQMGSAEKVTAKLAIELPRSGFELTPESISGHADIIYIDVPGSVVGPDGVHVPDSSNTKNTILFLYDLVVKNKNSFRRAAYKDDVEVD